MYKEWSNPNEDGLSIGSPICKKIKQSKFPCPGERLNLLPGGNLHGQISGQLSIKYFTSCKTKYFTSCKIKYLLSCKAKYFKSYKAKYFWINQTELWGLGGDRKSFRYKILHCFCLECMLQKYQKKTIFRQLCIQCRPNNARARHG